MKSFGSELANKRKELHLTQKELAARVFKEDGRAISPQYLNDIEHDRRSPSSDHLIDQFSRTLKLDKDLLYYLARQIPADVYSRKPDQEQVIKAMKAFRRVLKRST